MLLAILISYFFVNSIAKNTVETLDLEKYQGRWYQIYGNNFDQLFEKFSSCITADYALMPAGNVSVLPHDVPGKPENGRGMGALRHAPGGVKKESKRNEGWLLQ